MRIELTCSCGAQATFESSQPAQCTTAAEWWTKNHKCYYIAVTPAVPYADPVTPNSGSPLPQNPITISGGI